MKCFNYSVGTRLIIAASTGIWSLLASQACVAQYQIGPAIRLPEPVNTIDGWESTPSISANGLELFYTGRNFDVRVATRVSNDVPFAESRLVNDLTHPFISSDGLTLFGNMTFTGNGDPDIGFATRESIDKPWGRVQALSENVNSRQWERFPTISSDGLELYFQRSPSFTSSDANIWVSKRTSVDEEFGPSTKLPDEISVGWTAPGGLSPDGLTLFFSSNRPGGFGKDDLYSTTRANRESPWQPPVNLGPNVNTKGFEDYPRMATDGSELYFSRGPETLDINNGATWRSDIYVAQVVPEPNSAACFPFALLVALAVDRKKRR